MSEPLHICIVAGESSGDRLGAALMRRLREETGGAVRFSGVGGEAMTAEGLESLFPMQDIAVIGFTEIIPHIPRILRRMREAVTAISAAKPDALVTIDAQVFTAMLAKRIKAKAPDTALIQYVAPTVWAWKKWRAKKIARIFDRVLTLFPFEPPYFEAHGLAADYVGHPVVERVAQIGPTAPKVLRRTFGIAPDTPVLLVAPGSRRSEISRLAGPISDAVARLARRVERLEVIIPVAAAVEHEVMRATEAWPVKTHLLRSGGIAIDKAERRKFAAFAAADVALVASGTVSLEVAAMRTPMIVAYQVPKSTEFIIRRLVNVDTFTLINLIVGRKAVPEYLQERCNGGDLAEALVHLMQDDAAKAVQLSAFEEAFASFGEADAPPSLRAARGVLAAIADKNQRLLKST